MAASPGSTPVAFAGLGNIGRPMALTLIRAGWSLTVYDPVPEKARKMMFLVAQLTRTYVGAEYDFDVQLVLRADAVPEVEMTDAGVGPRLGWNMWTISERPPAAVDDAVFEGEWVTGV